MASPQAPGSRSADRRPLFVTSDGDLLDDLLRLAVAASVDAEVAPDPVAARAAWPRAPLVLIGDDVAEVAASAHLRRRADVILVGRDLDDAGIWQRAVTVGAEQVAVLPDAESWLVARLSDSREGRSERGRVVGVVGGRGGAGATTLAAALAVTAMRLGRTTMLIDADPLGGGADLVFGGEDTAGLRWPDLATTHGRIGGNALREALPCVPVSPDLAGSGGRHVNGRRGFARRRGEGGLAVLSWDRGDLFELAPEAMESVIDAATRACELVVLDVPRYPDAGVELALALTDLALLIVPAEVRATAAATRVATMIGRFASDVRLVVRGPAPGGLDAHDVAAALRLPLAGALKPEADLAAALERGEAPAGRGVGPLADLCRRVLADLDLPDLGLPGRDMPAGTSLAGGSCLTSLDDSPAGVAAADQPVGWRPS